MVQEQTAASPTEAQWPPFRSDAAARGGGVGVGWVRQQIIDDPLMRNSVLLVMANKQDLVSPPPLVRSAPAATAACAGAEMIPQPPTTVPRQGCEMVALSEGEGSPVLRSCTNQYGAGKLLW